MRLVIREAVREEDSVVRNMKMFPNPVYSYSWPRAVCRSKSQYLAAYVYAVPGTAETPESRCPSYVLSSVSLYQI